MNKIYKQIERRQSKEEKTTERTNKMGERNIKGLNFDINDEKELSDYMELTFNSLLGDKVKNVNNVLYKIAINISSNDISKAEINKLKRPRKDENEIIFF